jgi:hypothetical protein
MEGERHRQGSLRQAAIIGPAAPGAQTIGPRDYGGSLRTLSASLIRIMARVRNRIRMAMTKIWRASWKSEVQSTPLLLKAWFSNQTSAEPKGRQPIRASKPPSGLSQFPPGAPQRLPARPSRPATRRRSRIRIRAARSAATGKMRRESMRKAAESAAGHLG